jgi:CBS domain-containing protein
MKVRDILKTDDIITVSPEKTLSYALSKLSSSHDVAFVFDKNENFLGVINPYYCVIKTSYPGNTKVEHCLYHPPKIKLNDPLTKAVRLLIDSKIHYLPVFDDKNKFVGIITARRVLSTIVNDPVFKVKIKEFLKTKRKPLVTVFDDDNINHALTKFKNHRISKIVVVNKDFRLKGILSYYDLIMYLTLPRVKETKGERIGNKSNFYFRPIKHFIKSYVLTVTENDLMSQVLNLILTKSIGSVVVINELRQPIAIITTRDLLNLYFFPTNEKKVELIIRNLSEKNRQILGGFFNHLKMYINKFPQIIGARLFIKEEKQGGLFKVALSLFLNKGKPKIIKKEGKNLRQLLKKISR